MSKKTELIGITDITHNKNFVSFKVIYNEIENIGTFRRIEHVKSISRLISGTLLDNQAESIIMHFNDTGESVTEVLGHGLHSVIEVQIRLYIHNEQNKQK